MSQGDSLGDRMKRHEVSVGPALMRRTPVIIRVDGKAFHTFTRKITTENDPTSEFHQSHKFHDVMLNVAVSMVGEIEGAQLAYTQSDEISILLRDWDTLETEAWFDYSTMKMTSVAASMATAYFNYYWSKEFAGPEWVGDTALFDARVFNVPERDVENYLIWRQKDGMRNSVNFVARKYFSQKQLNGKKVSDVKSMLLTEHGVQFDEYPIWEQRGSCAYRETDVFSSRAKAHEDNNIPVFVEDRNYIRKHLEITEDDNVRVR